MDFLPIELQVVIKDAVIAVLVALSGLILWGAKELIGIAKLWVQKRIDALEEKVGQDKVQDFLAFLERLVRALAQDPIFSQWTAEDVKEYAEQMAIKYCEKYDLPFDDEEINILIEAVYSEYKEFFGGKLPKRPAK